MKKIILLVVAAIAAASYLAYAYMNGDPMFGTLAKTMDDLPRNERLGSKRNIVVLGVDGREKDDDPGRSDTLFVVMFDPKSKNVSLLSIPRDTRVRIPGHGWDKINHAYAFGGYKLTQQTTEELLGIQVNNYVMVDFSGFEGLIDAIGGIDIDVEKDMYYYDDWDDFLIDLSAGPQHLDGKKAIQYVRYRDEEGDIGRIKRQQKFMLAVYEKIASAQILTKMPGLVSEIMKMVKTDLPVSDMLAMGGALHGMMKEQGGLQMATVPGTPEYIDEISYWIPDITDLREQMVDMQGAQMTERYRQGAEKMEAEYKRNLIAAQEKEKQQAVEEKLKEEEQTEKKIKAENKEKADAEKKAKSKKSKADELGPVETKTEDKMTAAPKAVKPPAKESSRTAVSVKVVDCSGKGAGSDAAARLAAMGFEVIDGGSDPERAQTTVVSTTSNGRVVSKLSTVPFPYTLRILRADDAAYDAVIFIGKDYQ
ncbi:LCP family glycopolymer transferase [Phascolarctobacterium sp.]